MKKKGNGIEISRVTILRIKRYDRERMRMVHHDILEQFYIKYYRAAYLYTFSLCRHKETTEDIVSQAFEKAFISLSDSRQDFKFWIFVVCKNLWIDSLRKNKRMVPEPLEHLKMASENDTVFEILKQEQNRMLYAQIEHLPYHYREILVLHYFAGIPVTQIACLLGITNSNAKTILCRARQKLKKNLEENHEL